MPRLLRLLRLLRRLCAPVAVGLVAVGLVAAATPVAAQKPESAPKPENYICPHATGGAVDCFLHAVEHLYTMCRQVKSIEIIEYGYEKSSDGVNGAKSEYCVDKHRASIARPYQSALGEAKASRVAVDGLRSIYDLWQKALADLKWNPGENDAEYKARVAKPYSAFGERATLVRATLAEENKTATATPAGKGKPATATPAGRGKAATAAVAPVPTKSTN